MLEKLDKILYATNDDIYSLLKLAEQVGWKIVRELDIYRMLYLSAVLYLFRFPGEQNPFFENYSFTVDYKGPYSEAINRSLIFLQNGKYIIHDNNSKTYQLNEDIDNKDFEPNERKQQWFESLIHLLSLHGINKIYEFVIRDPEFHENIIINSLKDLDLSDTNKTVLFLNEFKKKFEKELEIDSVKIGEKEYLQSYFEYVFSKIVKGDIELDIDL